MTVDNADYERGQTSARDCVFCDIVARRAPAQIVTETSFTTIIVPLNPVTEGHVLVIPHGHVSDALESPSVTGLTMTAACEYALKHQHCNLITSCGTLATQSVRHLHIHVIPRHPFDGLALPWGDNDMQSAEYRHNAYLFYSGEGSPTGRIVQ